ncbi:hypothetical protein Q5752_006545 [Cryptotrichosporon argae]
MEPERSLTPITELTTPGSLRTIRLPFVDDDDARSPLQTRFPDGRDADSDDESNDSHYSTVTIRLDEDTRRSPSGHYSPDRQPTFVPLAPTSPVLLPLRLDKVPVMSPAPARRTSLPPGAAAATFDGARSPRPSLERIDPNAGRDVPAPSRSAVTPVFPEVIAKPFPPSSTDAAPRSNIPVPTRTLEAKGAPAAPVIQTSVSPSTIGRAKTSLLPRPRVSSLAGAVPAQKVMPLTDTRIQTAQTSSPAPAATVPTPVATPKHTPAVTPKGQSPLPSPKLSKSGIPTPKHTPKHSPAPSVSISTVGTFGSAGEEPHRRYSDRYSVLSGEKRRLPTSSAAPAALSRSTKQASGDSRSASMTAVSHPAYKAPAFTSLNRASTQITSASLRPTLVEEAKSVEERSVEEQQIASDSDGGHGLAGVGARSASRQASRRSSFVESRPRPKSFYGTKHDGEEVGQQPDQAGAVDPTQLQAALQAEKDGQAEPKLVIHNPNDPANNVKHPIWVKPIFTPNLAHPTLHNVPVLDYDAEAELSMKTSRVSFRRSPKDRSMSTSGNSRPSSVYAAGNSRPTSLYVPNGRAGATRVRPNTYHGAYDSMAPTPLVTTPLGTPPPESGFDLSVLGRPTSLFSHEMTSYRIAGSPALSRNNSSADVAGLGVSTPTNISRGVSAADLPGLRSRSVSVNNSTVDVSQIGRDSVRMARGASVDASAHNRIGINSPRNASAVEISTARPKPVARTLSAVDVSSLRPDIGNVIPGFPPGHVGFNFPPPPATSPPAEPSHANEQPNNLSLENEPVPDAVPDSENSAPESPGLKTPEPAMSPPASPRVSHSRRNSTRVGSLIATMFGSKDSKDGTAQRAKSKSRRSTRTESVRSRAQTRPPSPGADDLVGSEPPRSIVRNATVFGIKDDGSELGTTPPPFLRDRADSTNSGSVVEFAIRRPLYVENAAEHEEAVDDVTEARQPVAKSRLPLPTLNASSTSLDLRPGQVYRASLPGLLKTAQDSRLNVTQIAAVDASPVHDALETLAPVVLDSQGNLAASPASMLGLLPGEPASPSPISEAMRHIGESMRRMAMESLDMGSTLVGMSSPTPDRPALSSLGQVAESPEYDGLPPAANGHPYAAGPAALSSVSLVSNYAARDPYTPSPPRPTASRLTSRSMSSLHASPAAAPPSTLVAADFLREADRLGKEGWASLRQAEEIWTRAMTELRGIIDNPATLQAGAAAHLPGSSIYNSTPPGLGIRTQPPSVSGHQVEPTDATVRDATIRAQDASTLRAVSQSAAQSRVSVSGLYYNNDYGSTTSLPPQWLYPQPPSDSGTSAPDSKDSRSGATGSGSGSGSASASASGSGAGSDVKVRAAMSTTAVDELLASPTAPEPASFSAVVGGYSADQLKMHFKEGSNRASFISTTGGISNTGPTGSRKLSKRRPSESGGRRWFGLRRAEVAA